MPYLSSCGVGSMGEGAFFVDGAKVVDHMGKDWCPSGINQFFQDHLNHMFQKRPSLTTFVGLSARGRGTEDVSNVTNTGPRDLYADNEIVAVPPICKYPGSPFVGADDMNHRHTLQTFDADSYRKDLKNLLLVVRMLGDRLRDTDYQVVFAPIAGSTTLTRLERLDGVVAINNLYAKAKGVRGLPGADQDHPQEGAVLIFRQFMGEVREHIRGNGLYNDCVNAVQGVPNLDTCDDLAVFMHIVTHLARATKNLTCIASHQNDRHYTGARLTFTQDQLHLTREALPANTAGGLVAKDTYVRIRELMKQIHVDDIYTVGQVFSAQSTQVYPRAVCRVKNVMCKLI